LAPDAASNKLFGPGVIDTIATKMIVPHIDASAILSLFFYSN
jgi:hypothetical protein